MSWKKVLVIEDEEACQLLLQALLERFPVDVSFFKDAESGLAALERVRPDLVLVDVFLPGMDGVAATETLRSRPGFEETPIVVTTSVDASTLSIEARDAGANTYLVKPITEDALAEVLERYLGVKKGAARPGGAGRG